MGKQIRRIALSGFFIATNIVLTRFLAGDLIVGGLSILRISFGPVPLFLGGILLGPVYGAICGILADPLGYIVKPLGPYFPGFTLNAALTGMIPGLFFKFGFRSLAWWWLFTVITVTELVTSIALTPLWLSMITGKAFIAFIPSTIVSRAFLIPIYVALVKVLLRYSKHAMPSLNEN